MTVKTNLQDSLRQKMKAKAEGVDVSRDIRVLRSVIAEITAAETSGKSRSELDDPATLAVLRKAADRRKATAQEFRGYGENDRAAEEELEARLIEEFLPTEKSADEVRTIVENMIEEKGLTGPAGIGAVMKAVSGDPSINNKVASGIARELLT